MQTMQVSVVSLSWFDRDDYEAFRKILPDRSWHRTYDEWLAAAETAFEQVRQDSRVTAYKSHVRSDEFVAWCRANSLDVKSEHLNTFANEDTVRQHREKTGQ